MPGPQLLTWACREATNSRAEHLEETPGLKEQKWVDRDDISKQSLKNLLASKNSCFISSPRPAIWTRLSWDTEMASLLFLYMRC